MTILNIAMQATNRMRTDFEIFLAIYDASKVAHPTKTFRSRSLGGKATESHLQSAVALSC